MALAVAPYGYQTTPSSLLNSIFISTVNTAAKALAAAATGEKWRPMDHLRFVFMVVTWLAVWFLRVLMDHFPLSFGSPKYLLDGFSAVGSLDGPPLSYGNSLDMVLHEGVEVLPIKALAGALSHILALLNELPATSRKYQFALSMADKIFDDNTRSGHEDLLYINRTALASSFSRTSALLYRSIKTTQAPNDCGGTWTTRIITLFPFGSVLAPYVGFVSGMCGFGKGKGSVAGERECEVAAEKHAQELVWLTGKMRGCGVVDEALLQWSFAQGLASLSLTANPRVQGLILKISAVLFGEMNNAKFEVPREVKFRLLALWLPLFCYAENGLSYPILTGYEKAEVERIMDDLISSLPLADQEIILTNWMQDFTISTSDWPNLQLSYNRWCQSTRKLIA